MQLNVFFFKSFTSDVLSLSKCVCSFKNKNNHDWEES